MAKKRSFAVLVGCNYPKTKYELRGCVNDVVAMREVLERRLRFERSRIELLTDELGSESPKPTGENIKRALSEMIDKAEPGDVLYFHYSGHGTRIPSLKPGNPLRKDEAIVPCDFNLITDVDFRHLVNRVPQGASFTILSDSCHSGGLIDKEKEQIGPKEISPKNTASETRATIRTRAISAESLLDHLSGLTNISAMAGVATHMLELFGTNASLAFTGGPAQLLKSKADEGILLSGCQADETSADVGEGGKARGAFSSAVQGVLVKDYSNNINGKAGLSNREVVVRARRVLRDKGFMTQHPCLYCTDRNADAIFLSHPST